MKAKYVDDLQRSESPRLVLTKTMKAAAAAAASAAAKADDVFDGGGRFFLLLLRLLLVDVVVIEGLCTQPILCSVCMHSSSRRQT